MLKMWDVLGWGLGVYCSIYSNDNDMRHLSES